PEDRHHPDGRSGAARARRHRHRRAAHGVHVGGDRQRRQERDRRDGAQPAASPAQDSAGHRAGESRRDAVKAFAYINPTSEKDATAALKGDGLVMPLAGGQDLLARMKDYVTQPDTIVNVKNALDAAIASTPDGGLKIGAAVKIVDLANHAQV